MKHINRVCTSLIQAEKFIAYAVVANNPSSPKSMVTTQILELRGEHRLSGEV